MKVILPIVGNDKAPSNSEYILSLFEINGKTIIEHIYESLKVIENAEFIVILRRSDIEKHHFDNIIRLLIPGVKIVVAEGETKGSACSCMLAIDHINDDEPLVITSSNQLFLDNANDILNDFIKKDYDGGIVTFEDIHPKFSYVKLDDDGFVCEVAEKRTISKNATVGFYYFKRGEDFIKSAVSMISKNAHVNGKFYICPVYNEMILEKKKIGIYRIQHDHYFFFKEEDGIRFYQNYLMRSMKQL